MAQLLAKRIKPLFDRVLVQKIPAPKKTSGGLYLPESAKSQELLQGTVVAVGPGGRNDQGTTVQISLKVGEKVILPQFGGMEFKQNEEEYVLLREQEIIATVKDSDK